MSPDNGFAEKAARLRSAVRGVLPRIMERSVKAEREGAIPAANLEDLESTGAHRFLESAETGGFGLPLELFLQMVMEISTACGSTAWTFMHFSVHNYVIQFQPEKIRQLVHRQGRAARLATSFMDGGLLQRRPEGGYSLSGKWPYVTGVHLADWVIVNAHLEDGAEAKVYLPADRVDVSQDWDTLGMRGTASHSISIDDMVIADEQVVTGSESEQSYHAARRRMKLNILPLPSMIALGTVTPILGMTLSCLNRYGNLLKKFTHEEKLLPGALERYARLNSLGAALELLQRESIRVLDRSVYGSALSSREKSSIHMNAAWVARSCREMVSEIIGASGTSALFLDNPMARQVASVMTLSTHYFIEYDRLSVNHGAVLLRRANA